MTETTMTFGLIGLVAGLLIGGGGMAFITRGRGGHDADAVAATAGVVEASVAVVDTTGDAVNAQRLAELELQKSIAASTVKVAGMQRLVQSDDLRLVAAITAYDVCVSAAQGKETSAAFNCEEAQQDVSEALKAILPRQ